MSLIFPLWISRWLIVEWGFGVGYYFRRHLPDKGLWFSTLLGKFMKILYVSKPGNPQSQLNFEQDTLVVEKCRCGKSVQVWALRLSDKTEFKFCKKCFGEVPMRYDSHIWHIIRRIEQ